MRNLEGKLEDTIELVEKLQQHLDGLSDAIWQSIDHNDPSLLEAGVKFKLSFNDKRGDLEAAAIALEQLLLACPLVGQEPTGGVTEPIADALDTDEEKQVPTQESNQGSELDFENKTPFGFVLGDKTFTSSGSWPLFYHTFLQELYRRKPEKLSKLPSQKSFSNSQGRPLFARNADPFNEPLAVTDHLFAEGDLPLSLLLGNMKRLLREIDVPVASLKILLKEKSRGTVETRSLAA